MYRLNLTGPIGLVIGNEGEGVSRLVKEKCDMIASIPMKGDIDSLNASVATGVLAYEIVRQRTGEGIEFKILIMKKDPWRGVSRVFFVREGFPTSTHRLKEGESPVTRKKASRIFRKASWFKLPSRFELPTSALPRRRSTS